MLFPNPPNSHPLSVIRQDQTGQTRRGGWQGCATHIGVGFIFGTGKEGKEGLSCVQSQSTPSPLVPASPRYPNVSRERRYLESLRSDI